MASTHATRAEGTTIVLTPTRGDADALIVVAHGLGDSAHGWVDTAEDVLAPAFPTAKIVLPTAPSVPVTVNGGAVMPAWYDIATFARTRADEKCAGIGASQSRLLALVAAEVDRGVRPSRVVLMGFSQGAALSLYTGLNYLERLGGVVVLSGYLPVPDSIRATPASLKTPVRFYHGDADPLLPVELAHDAAARCTALGAKDVAVKVYRGLAHGANAEELRDVVAFLKAVLPPLPPPEDGADA